MKQLKKPPRFTIRGGLFIVIFVYINKQPNLVVANYQEILKLSEESLLFFLSGK
ncbi:hypothetical protein WZ342_2464 [Enterococcus faecalis]|nr:hypothetical protein WZ342_2464 [Enterococcus faecalis]